MWKFNIFNKKIMFTLLYQFDIKFINKNWFFIGILVRLNWKENNFPNLYDDYISKYIKELESKIKVDSEMETIIS